jgi:catechol 2,3-dioxygenase-like lactoylglutathione lyase family enzyme
MAGLCNVGFVAYLGMSASMINGVFAGVVVADLDRARKWYAGVFGREPDALPMAGLLEWHIRDQRVQVVSLETVRQIQQLPDWGGAGASSLTLVVDDAKMAADAAVLGGGGYVSHFDGSAFQTSSVRDPDGNLITFLQPAGDSR